jgi:dihydropteroate synthase
MSPSRVLVLDRPRIMGVLNLTPDSFYAGSRVSAAGAVRAAAEALAAGADLLDLGGESTRPGAARVSADEQVRRTAGAIAAVRASLGDGFGITIDTTLTEVARAAFDAGADALNDVAGGTEDPGLLPLCARQRRGVILMHRRLPPERDAYSTDYPAEPAFDGGVVESVRSFLEARAGEARAAGIDGRAIVVDPGLGFGKSVAQNLELIAGTPRLASLGYPVLSALSRKSFTAAAAGLPEGSPPEARLAPTLALSLEHVRRGAAIVRVHDVGAHAAALRAAAAVPGP